MLSRLLLTALSVDVGEAKTEEDGEWTLTSQRKTFWVERMGRENGERERMETKRVSNLFVIAFSG
jgi:hypothetical protein